MCEVRAANPSGVIPTSTRNITIPNIVAKLIKIRERSHSLFAMFARPQASIVGKNMSELTIEIIRGRGR
jgi:hypothetical protein